VAENGKSRQQKHDKRPDKADRSIDFDPAKNTWTKVLVKARRLVGKLSTEQHILETFAGIDQSRSKVVKQQQELLRCQDAVQRCWEVRACHTCERGIDWYGENGPLGVICWFNSALLMFRVSKSVSRNANAW
jgi:hypothetical protein